jgi:hypothetical protein
MKLVLGLKILYRNPVSTFYRVQVLTELLKLKLFKGTVVHELQTNYSAYRVNFYISLFMMVKLTLAFHTQK